VMLGVLGAGTPVYGYVDDPYVLFKRPVCCFIERDPYVLFNRPVCWFLEIIKNVFFNNDTNVYE